MKRCIFCGNQIEENEPICPQCGKDMNPDSFTESDIRYVRRHAYREITNGENKKDGALTFYVIGGILLVIAIIFFVLSFRFNTAKQRVFKPASTEFVVSMITMVCSLTLLTWGSVRLVKALKRIHFYKRVIEDIDKK